MFFLYRTLVELSLRNPLLNVSMAILFAKGVQEISIMHVACK